MLVRRVIPFLFLAVLPGCFLNQTAPKPADKPVSPPYVGRVAIEDVRGYGEMATFYAIFGKLAAAPAAASLRSYQLARMAAAPRAQAPKCEFGKATKSSRTARAEAEQYINVGTMAFGPALQGSGQEVTTDAKNRYVTSIDPGVPAGLYSIVASGAGEIAKFGDILSMPEEIREATGNNVRFEDGIPLLHGQALKISWNKPVMENEMNYMLVDMLAENETEIFQIHCSAMEAAFGTTTNKLTWEIPASEMEKLPVTTSAAVYFVRAHVRQVANTQVTVEFQGIRTYLAQAAIFETTDELP